MGVGEGVGVEGNVVGEMEGDKGDKVNGNRGRRKKRDEVIAKSDIRKMKVIGEGMRLEMYLRFCQVALSRQVFCDMMINRIEVDLLCKCLPSGNSDGLASNEEI